MEQLVGELGTVNGRSKTANVENILYLVELLARNGKLSTENGFTLDFAEASSIVNARGHGARHLDPVELAGGEQVHFDVSLLERSGKSKSGFAGVYATTGSSFRALVPDLEQGGSRYLTSRPTAVHAAIDRWHYYEQHGIPYGNIGFHVEHLRSLNPALSVEGALRQLLDMGEMYGIKNPYKLDDVQRILDRHLARNGGKSSVPVEPAPAPKPIGIAEDGKAYCAICKDEIVENEPFSPHGKTEYAHAGCKTPSATVAS